MAILPPPVPVNKKPLPGKIATWFKTITKPRGKCTCAKPAKTAKPKAKKLSVEPISLPRKYANETKLYAVVGGLRVPFIPAQVSQLKDGRKSYDPIEEITSPRCAYCQACRLTQSSCVDNEDDY